MLNVLISNNLIVCVVALIVYIVLLQISIPFSAVDQAVSLNDQAIMVDFLSVITLRPSIWNLDLCESLLPVIGELLQTKYEM